MEREEGREWTTYDETVIFRRVRSGQVRIGGRIWHGRRLGARRTRRKCLVPASASASAVSLSASQSVRLSAGRRRCVVLCFEAGVLLFRPFTRSALECIQASSRKTTMTL